MSVCKTLKFLKHQSCVIKYWYGWGAGLLYVKTFYNDLYIYPFVMKTAYFRMMKQRSSFLGQPSASTCINKPIKRRKKIKTVLFGFLKTFKMSGARFSRDTNNLRLPHVCGNQQNLESSNKKYLILVIHLHFVSIHTTFQLLCGTIFCTNAQRWMGATQTL